MADTLGSAAGAGVPVGAVVGLLAIFADGSEEQFSGALISPTEVLTAAHGVWVQGVGAAVEVIALVGGVPSDLSVAGSEPVFQTGTYAAAVHVNPVQDAGGTLALAGTEADEAVVDFGVALTSGPVFGLNPDVASASVTVAGFPASGAGQELSATGTVTQQPGTNAYDGETGLGAGSSGGPIFTLAGGQAELVGTVSTTAYATQLSAALLAQIHDWQAEDVPTPLADATSTTAPGSAGLYGLDNGTLVSQGSDTVQAGSGDAVVYAAGPGASILGGAGSLTVVGGTGSDTVRPGSGSSVLYGGSGGGVFDASTGGQSIIVAGAGNTTLIGGGDGDTLFCAPIQDGNVAAAGAGSEVIVAGQGATTILGGTGTATVFAGSGPETFQVWGGLGGTLQIVGFTPADALQFSASDPMVAKSSGSWGTVLTFADSSRVVLFDVSGLSLPAAL